ncbi:hypothetical protein [Roseibium album]|uniref:hypothetical protein n=1 Tax=Roseibium album TaxID=311410 RepID=UPI0024910080|nr:hypothetical protein [Roseibium album]
MMIAFMGIDLAKNVFLLHGVDAEGNAVFKKRIRREGLLAELSDIAICQIGIETCTGACYWQRQFEAFGYTVEVIALQYVKPFLKHQKNDRNNAEAI